MEDYTGGSPTRLHYAIYINITILSRILSGFFLEKKGRGLCPCIDYRSLNNVTVKYPHPLPLVPAAQELACETQIFTKLDLHSTYNLIRIKECDKWKMAFNLVTTITKVMPYGLAGVPSMFQCFINDVFHDCLGKYVIAYVDDILN